MLRRYLVPAKRSKLMKFNDSNANLARDVSIIALFAILSPCDWMNLLYYYLFIKSRATHTATLSISRVAFSILFVSLFGLAVATSGARQRLISTISTKSKTNSRAEKPHAAYNSWNPGRTVRSTDNSTRISIRISMSMFTGGGRTSIRISAPLNHLLRYPWGCPCRIIRDSDSSTRVDCYHQVESSIRFGDDLLRAEQQRSETKGTFKWKKRVTGHKALHLKWDNPDILMSSSSS